MFGKNSSISGSSANVELNLTLDLKNATFSGITTFDSAVINNSTLTQVGDASFENVTINGTLSLTDITGNLVGDVTGDVTGDLTGDVTGDATGDVTGNVTGILYPDNSGTSSITGFTNEGIKYSASPPSNSLFETYHWFTVNNKSISLLSSSAIDNYVLMTTKGITNNTTNFK